MGNHEPVDVVLAALRPLPIVLPDDFGTVPQDVSHLLEPSSLLQKSGRWGMAVAVGVSLLDPRLLEHRRQGPLCIADHRVGRIYSGPLRRRDLLSGRRCRWGLCDGLDVNHPNAHEGDSWTDLLSYNAATGLSVYSIGNGVSQTVLRTTQAAAGWTSIVPFDLNGDDLTDLLSYNAASGLAYYSIAVGPGIQQVVGPPTTGATWWTSIVPMKLTPDPRGVTRGLTDLLFYK